MKTILVLWLVLNYKLFCDGVTEKYKKYSSDFHKILGPELLKMYQTEVFRPSRVQLSSRDAYPELVLQFPKPDGRVQQAKAIELIEVDVNETGT